MREPNVTRRRVLQGAGAIGIAGLGTTAVTAQQTDEEAAIRVAHASPDAPDVDVRLKSVSDTTGAATPGDETTSEVTTGGGEILTVIGGLAFSEVSGYQTIEPGTYQLQILPANGGLLGGLFGNGNGVTILDEATVEITAGTTYTAVAYGELSQGVATTPAPADGTGATLTPTAAPTGTATPTADGMGTDQPGAANQTDGMGTDQPGTANQTDGMGTDQPGAANQTGGTGTSQAEGTGTAQTETADGEALVEGLGFGEYESVTVQPGEYTLRIRETAATGTGDDADSTGGGFQTEVIEDDLGDPGDQRARVRLFHAVPDVGEVTVTAATSDAAGTETLTATETPTTTGTAAATETTAGNQTGADGQTATGDQTATAEETATPAGTATDGGSVEGDTGQAGQVRETQGSFDAGVVYSGFAMGYFDPSAVPTTADGTTDTQTDGTPTADTPADENATAAPADGNATTTPADENATAAPADGNATTTPADENATAAPTTDTPTDGQDTGTLVENAREAEFEFVVVETARDGQRASGGTDDLLGLGAPIR